MQRPEAGVCLVHSRYSTEATEGECGLEGHRLQRPGICRKYVGICRESLFSSYWLDSW